MSAFSLMVRLAAGLCWLVLTTTAQAVADDVIVAPGSAVIVQQVKGVVKDATAERGGTVLTSASKTTPPMTTLIYMPPTDVRELDDVIQYKLDDVQQRPLSISVRARAPTLDSAKLYDASFKAIFVLFILAVLVESGLALLFRWRPFLDYFDSRSTNALVAFVFSLILVRLFNLDIANQLIGIYSETSSLASKDWMGWPGSLLTAMIIAGGSSGVNRIFQSFGFRPGGDDKPAPPKLLDNQAWVAVTLIREKAVGTADVLIKGAVAGTISGASPKGRFCRYFIRDKGRFPQTGGYTIVPGADYKIEVQAYDASGAPLQRKDWGPYDIASRAIIDIELKV